MNQKISLILILSFCCFSSNHGIDSLKGIWSDIKSFPPFTSSFWKGLGESFGAPPAGYQMSFKVHNDIQKPVYVTINEIMSIMGADLSKPHGWHRFTIAPGASESFLNKPYYFELLIKSSPKKYSSNMPYLPHDDVLLRYDAISLPSQNHPNRVYYFRSCVAKQLIAGSYQYLPAAECVGYTDVTVAGGKNTGSMSLSSTLQNITIYNSTDTDIDVGFSNVSGGVAPSKANCLVYASLPAYSFGLLENFASLQNLIPGVIAVFDKNTQALIAQLTLPTRVFADTSGSSMPYTAVIYQNDSKATIEIDLEGVTPGNYDQPSGMVRDITPVTCVLWCDSVAAGSKKQFNVPGSCWIVAFDSQNFTIVTDVQPGQAKQWSLMRPELGKKTWIYFVYVTSADQTKAKQFLSNIFAQGNKSAVIEQYQEQAKQQMNLVHQANISNAKTVVPKSLLVQAAQGILNLHGGRIQDSKTGLTGYLLGADVFLSNGAGAGPMYYYLSPSTINAAKKPTSSVQNLFASTLSTTAPPGMPTAEVV